MPARTLLRVGRRRSRLTLPAAACVVVALGACGDAAGRPASPGPAKQSQSSQSQSSPAQAVLERTSYRLGLSGWHGRQEPAGTRRIRVTRPPGKKTDHLRPRERVVRFELRPGDRTGAKQRSRAELFGRVAQPTSLPPDLWPDPVNSQRWYGFSFFVGRHFPLARDAKWLVITQWKGLTTGRPPVAVEFHKRRLQIVGPTFRFDLGKVRRGRWTRLAVGIRFSPWASQGWVAVMRDGTMVLPTQNVPTMGLRKLPNGTQQADPVYLKQGLYRDLRWNVTQRIYFGPLTILDGSAPSMPAGRRAAAARASRG